MTSVLPQPKYQRTAENASKQAEQIRQHNNNSKTPKGGPVDAHRQQQHAANLAELISVISQFLGCGFSLLPNENTEHCLFKEREIEVGCASLLESILPNSPLTPVSDPHLVQCAPLMSNDYGYEYICQHFPPTYRCFFAINTPTMSVFTYAYRLMSYLHCSPETFIWALIYIHRAARNGLPFTPRSAHRVLLAALLVAVKMRDDRYFTMTYYAKLGGVTLKDLNIMEVSFLKVHKFAMSVTPSEYSTMLFAVRSFAEQLPQPQVPPSAPAPPPIWDRLVSVLTLPYSTIVGTEDEEEEQLFSPFILSPGRATLSPAFVRSPGMSMDSFDCMPGIDPMSVEPPTCVLEGSSEPLVKMMSSNDENQRAGTPCLSASSSVTDSTRLQAIRMFEEHAGSSRGNLSLLVPGDEGTLEDLGDPEDPSDNDDDDAPPVPLSRPRHHDPCAGDGEEDPRTPTPQQFRERMSSRSFDSFCDDLSAPRRNVIKSTKTTTNETVSAMPQPQLTTRKTPLQRHAKPTVARQPPRPVDASLGEPVAEDLEDSPPPQSRHFGTPPPPKGDQHNKSDESTSFHHLTIPKHDGENGGSCDSLADSPERGDPRTAPSHSTAECLKQQHLSQNSFSSQGAMETFSPPSRDVVMVSQSLTPNTLPSSQCSGGSSDHPPLSEEAQLPIH